MQYEEIKKIIDKLRKLERVLAYAIRVYYVFFSVTAITAFMKWSSTIDDFFGKGSMASIYIVWTIIASALLVTVTTAFVIEQKKKSIAAELKPYQSWITSWNVPVTIFLLSLSTLWVYILSPITGFVLSTLGLIFVEWYHRDTERAFVAILAKHRI